MDLSLEMDELFLTGNGPEQTHREVWDKFAMIVNGHLKFNQRLVCIIERVQSLLQDSIVLRACAILVMVKV